MFLAGGQVLRDCFNKDLGSTPALMLHLADLALQVTAWH